MVDQLNPLFGRPLGRVMDQPLVPTADFKQQLTNAAGGAPAATTAAQSPGGMLVGRPTQANSIVGMSPGQSQPSYFQDFAVKMSSPEVQAEMQQAFIAAQQV